MIASYFTMDIV